MTHFTFSEKQRAHWYRWFRDRETELEVPLVDLVAQTLGEGGGATAALRSKVSRVRQGHPAGLKSLLLQDDFRAAIAEALGLEPGDFRATIEGILTGQLAEVPTLPDPPVLAFWPAEAREGDHTGGDRPLTRQPLLAWLQRMEQWLASDAGTPVTCLQVGGEPKSGQSHVMSVCRERLGARLSVVAGDEPPRTPGALRSTLMVRTTEWGPEDLERNLDAFTVPQRERLRSAVITPWRAAPFALPRRLRRIEGLAELLGRALRQDIVFDAVALRRFELSYRLSVTRDRVDASAIANLSHHLRTFAQDWLSEARSLEAGVREVTLETLLKKHARRPVKVAELDVKTLFAALDGDHGAKESVAKQLGAMAGTSRQRQALFEAGLLQRPADTTRAGEAADVWALTHAARELFALLLARGDGPAEALAALAVTEDGVMVLSDWALLRAPASPERLVVAARSHVGRVRTGYYAAALHAWAALGRKAAAARKREVVEAWAALMWTKLHGTFSDTRPQLDLWSDWQVELLRRVSEVLVDVLPTLTDHPHEQLRALVPPEVGAEAGAWRTVPAPPSDGPGSDHSVFGSEGWPHANDAAAGMVRLAPYQVSFRWLCEQRSAERAHGMFWWARGLVIVDEAVVRRFARAGDPAAIRALILPEGSPHYSLLRDRLRVSPSERMTLLAEHPSDDLRGLAEELTANGAADARLSGSAEWRAALELLGKVYPGPVGGVLLRSSLRRRFPDAGWGQQEVERGLFKDGYAITLAGHTPTPAEGDPWELEMLVRIGLERVVESIAQLLDEPEDEWGRSRVLPLVETKHERIDARRLFEWRHEAVLALASAGNGGPIRESTWTGPGRLRVDELERQRAWSRAFEPFHAFDTLSDPVVWSAVRDFLLRGEGLVLRYRDTPSFRHPAWSLTVPALDAPPSERMTHAAPWLEAIWQHMPEEHPGVFEHVTRRVPETTVTEPQELWKHRVDQLLDAGDRDTFRHVLQARVEAATSLPIHPEWLVSSPPRRESCWRAAHSDAQRGVVVELVLRYRTHELEEHWGARLRRWGKSVSPYTLMAIGTPTEREDAVRDHLESAMLDPLDRLYHARRLPWRELRKGDIEAAHAWLAALPQTEVSRLALRLHDPEAWFAWQGAPEDEIKRLLRALYKASRSSESPSRLEFVAECVRRGVLWPLDELPERKHPSVARACVEAELQRERHLPRLWSRLDSDEETWLVIARLRDVLRDRLTEDVAGRYAHAIEAWRGPRTALIHEAFQEDPVPWLDTVRVTDIAALDAACLDSIEGLIDGLPAWHPDRARVLAAIHDRRVGLNDRRMRREAM